MKRKAIVFVGGLGNSPTSLSGVLSNYITSQLKEKGIDATLFDVNEAGIPLLNFSSGSTPKAVEIMAQQFLEADFHVWMTPLYHGSIPGIMKNTLDWLEITSKYPTPYLTDKMVGLICWGDGMQAMQGINTMNFIAKGLRAWTVPFSIPITAGEFFTPEKENEINPFYKEKIDLLINILLKSRIERI